MTTLAQRLRQKLLDLAIHGRLVRQDPHDEPAGELLARIRKARSAQNGRARTPAVPFPVADDEKPFDLPKGWVWCRLGEICAKIGAGSTPKGGKRVYVSEGVKFIREQNVYCDGLHSEGMAYIDEDTNRNMSGSVVCAGDLLMNITGGSIGRTALVPDDFDCANVNQHVLIVRPVDRAVREYLHVCCCSPLLVGLMASRQTGDKPGLSAEKVRTFPIPLPPLAEQKRIVEKLNGMLDAVAQIADGETRLSHLRKKARAKILDLAIRGKLVKQEKGDEPADVLIKRIAAEKARLVVAKKIKKEKPLPPIGEDEIPFDLPKGWAWARWGELSESIQYGFNAPAKKQGRIKMVRITDIQDGKILWTGVPFCNIEESDIPNYLLRKGDILFARTGGTVGKSYLVGDVPEESVYAGYLIRTRCCASLLPDYFKLFMESELYWAQLKEGTIATAQPNCNGKTLSRMIVPLPPLAEQKRIVSKVKEMLAACEKLGVSDA